MPKLSLTTSAAANASCLPHELGEHSFNIIHFSFFLRGFRINSSFG